MSDEIETIDKNPKSWAAWKREAERLQAIIDDMVLAAMDSEPVAVTDDELNAALQLHRLKVDGHSQLSDSFRAGFRYARRTTPQPAPVVPELRVDWQENEFSAGWNACRAAMLQAPPICTCHSSDGSLRWTCPVHPGNYQVIPDGYALVPKEPTSEMVKKMRYHAGSYDRNIKDGYKAMLAAAPQLPGSEPATVPGKWIPVSERMPEVGEVVITAMGWVVNVGEMECSAANYRFFTSVISGRELPATHWMPLPVAPQEVKQ